MTDRKRTPMGDMRERGVPCQRCRRETWNIIPVCDACHAREELHRVAIKVAQPEEKK